MDSLFYCRLCSSFNREFKDISLKVNYLEILRLKYLQNYTCWYVSFSTKFINFNKQTISKKLIRFPFFLLFSSIIFER